MPPTSLYLDHAATTFPKPPEVLAAMNRFLTESGGNPGRSGHALSRAAAEAIFDTRQTLAEWFGMTDTRRVIFTSGATAAINLVLFGWLRPGEHVVTSSVEHNAVQRPLRVLAEERGIQVTRVAADPLTGLLDPADVRRALRPATRLLVLNHGSNVTGAVQDLRTIRAECPGVPMLVDAAQTAGALELKPEDLGIDFTAFTGHKALLGPPGTGGLLLASDRSLRPLVFGSTGSKSESDLQPDFLPDRLESGTPNGVGLAGLGAGVKVLLAHGVQAIREKETRLTQRMLLRFNPEAIPGVTLHGRAPLEHHLALIGLTCERLPLAELALRLEREHGVMGRVGLQCAPEAHRTLGTFPGGTLRLSASVLTTEDEIDRAAQALAALVGGNQS